MAKLKKVLTADNGLIFDDCCSFETEHYVGIWSDTSDRFLLVAKNGRIFSQIELPICSDYSELFDAVYNECEEVIEEVYSSGGYEIAIERE